MTDGNEKYSPQRKTALGLYKDWRPIIRIDLLSMHVSMCTADLMKRCAYLRIFNNPIKWLYYADFKICIKKNPLIK